MMVLTIQLKKNVYEDEFYWNFLTRFLTDTAGTIPDVYRLDSNDEMGNNSVLCFISNHHSPRNRTNYFGIVQNFQLRCTRKQLLHSKSDFRQVSRRIDFEACSEQHLDVIFQTETTNKLYTIGALKAEANIILDILWNDEFGGNKHDAFIWLCYYLFRFDCAQNVNPVDQKMTVDGQVSKNLVFGRPLIAGETSYFSPLFNVKFTSRYLAHNKV
jgi:hypothetical protein